MTISKTILGLAAGAALLGGMAGRSQAWSVYTGCSDADAPCSAVSYAQGSTTLFTLTPTVYDYQDSSNKTVYTYRYDLFNNSDKSGLTSLSVGVKGASDFGTSNLSFYSGFGPLNGTALHDSLVGNDSSSAIVYAGDDGANIHTHNVSAQATGNYVTFTDVAAAIKVGQSNGSQLTTPFQYYGVTPGEEFFVQSYNAPTQDDMKITDGAGNTYQVLACGPGNVPLSPAAVPEPATVVPFALGALGLLAVASRARRSRVAA